ncbi:MAG: hypothetical protein A2Y10_09895 [Planctomycetes bacterium GWF2_41_51]|nr:MAG: hypothetical protein A2Y10_09895 [Planctomycetes bacterium GWF2_41_51]HBG27431.1 hypothetical protein [Phycisphaerales bacterium]
MRAKQILQLSLITIFVFGSASAANTIVQTIYFGQDGIFNQFDCSTGTLNFIRIDITLNIYGGQFNYDNDSTSEASGNLQFGETAGVRDTSDVCLLESLNDYIFDDGNIYAYTSCNFVLSPDNGDGGTNYDSTPPDGAVLFGSDKSVTESGYIPDVFWTQGDKGFLGTGTYTILYSLMPWTDFTGQNVNQIQFSCTPPVSADGSITVIYDYDAIPEPAALSLLTAGIFVCCNKKKS